MGSEMCIRDRATGRSPLPTYRELISRYRGRLVSFAHARVFLLDEYVGLDPEHPQSCESFIRRELLDHVDAPEDVLAVPECAPADFAAAAGAYERRIADAGGIDLQLLGIGRNGHIGFNEPPSSLGSRTRLTTLAEATRRDNASSFDDDPDMVPKRGITQGVGTILEARHVVLIATGEAKSGPIARAVEGPVTAMVPASALQLHPHATVLVDEAAGQQLQHADYYREAHRDEPPGDTPGASANSQFLPRHPLQEAGELRLRAAGMSAAAPTCSSGGDDYATSEEYEPGP